MESKHAGDHLASWKTSQKNFLRILSSSFLRSKFQPGYACLIYKMV